MASPETQRGRFGIRAKFVTAFAILALVVTALIFVIENRRVRRAAENGEAANVEATASAVSAAIVPFVETAAPPDLSRTLAAISRTAAVASVDVVGAGGRVLGRAGGAMPAAMPPGAGDHLSTVTAQGDAGRTLYLVVAPVPTRGDAPAWLRLALYGADAAGALSSAIDVLLIVGAVAAAVGLAWVVSTSLIAPLVQLTESAGRVASGDLTHRSEIAGDDEVGALAEAFNAMAAGLERTVRSLAAAQTKLKAVIESVSGHSRIVTERVDEQRAIIDDTYRSIDHLDSGARKITENVETLSASSEETSSSLLEMAASMEEVSRHTDTLFDAVEDTASATNEMVTSINEVDQNVVYLTNFVTDTSSSMVQMSASIAQVETNAARSYELTLAVAEAAESGMNAVRETIDGMEQIRHSVFEANSVVSRLGERSVAIGKILNVIEDVAEQTNLLALNAAILAAQAGEYGKGFSVVAAEIRELSERTASSTRDIASLIRSVQEEVKNALKSMSAGSKLVEKGVALSHEAGRTLNRILESASKASDMGKEIAGATREQAKGSDTVTRSVGQLQEMVGQINAATRQQAQGSEHIMRAVESMREVTRYVRQAMDEQRTGSGMISGAAERMIDMIHEIFQVAATQATESEKIVTTMQQVRNIADGNRSSAVELSEAVALLSDAIRGLEDEVRKFRVRA